MNIVHNPEKHVFIAVTDNGKEIGSIQYAPGESDDVIIATHTHVNAEFQGQGVAEKLLDALVAFAGENGLTITPVCSFVIASFQRHPEKYAKIANTARASESLPG